ncbi:MAG: DUF2062 domain-containing protein [Myxococcota bacterium]
MKDWLMRLGRIKAPGQTMSETGTSEARRLDPDSEAHPVPSAEPRLRSVPPPEPRPSLWKRLRRLIVHNLLHLDDTPHRIAAGVFLGFLIGATPTIGIQVALYLLVAPLIGANRVSGILPIWISNPLTAVPLYYAEWQVGRLVVTGSFGTSDESWGVLARVIRPDLGQTWSARLLELDLYVSLFHTLVDMGVELWVGSLVVGTLSGALGYWVARRMVTRYRAKKAEAR